MKRRWLAIAAVPAALLPLTSCISTDVLGARPLDFECGAGDLAGFVSSPRLPAQIAEIRRDAGGDFGEVASPPEIAVQDVGFVENADEVALSGDPVYGALQEGLRFQILEGPGAAPEPIRILMLSGGGQWGAFGAGFLNQLAKDGELPKFDLVTGVSTGAIQSLFAVREDYSGMVEEYTKDEPLVNVGGLFSALFKGYLNDTAPLRGRIEGKLCQDATCAYLTQIAKAKRRVVIGMVDAASGDFHVIDIGQMLRKAKASGALDRPEGARRMMSCVAGVTLASSAVPVQLRPVRLHEPGTSRFRTYTDGGVRMSVFDDYVSSMAAQFAADYDHPVEIYVVRNGPTVVEPSLPEDGAELADIDRRPNAPAVGMKAYATLVNQNELMSIAALRLNYPTGAIFVATADGYNTRGLAWRTSVPCPKPGKDEKNRTFNNAFMRCLAAWGADKAQHHAKPWIELSVSGPSPSPTPGDS